MSNVIQSGHGAAEFSLGAPRLSWRDAASTAKANKNGHNSTGRRCHCNAATGADSRVTR
jgi:hypothetical protein